MGKRTQRPDDETEHYRSWGDAAQDLPQSEIDEFVMDDRDRRELALIDALRRIAEGNLGDYPWQANYAQIKEIARAALEGRK